MLLPRHSACWLPESHAQLVQPCYLSYQPLADGIGLEPISSYSPICCRSGYAFLRTHRFRAALPIELAVLNRRLCSYKLRGIALTMPHRRTLALIALVDQPPGCTAALTAASLASNSFRNATVRSGPGLTIAQIAHALSRNFDETPCRCSGKCSNLNHFNIRSSSSIAHLQ